MNQEDFVEGYAKKCAIRTRPTHNMSSSRFCIIWYGITDRCRRAKNKSYKNYGGRGIKSKWKDFDSFKKDMFKSYQAHIKKFGEKQTSIDRINGDGDYSKENCKWSTRLEQANNTRFNKKITFEGKTMSMADWSRLKNIPYYRLRGRLNMGWSIEKALLTKEKMVGNKIYEQLPNGTKQ